MEQYFEPTQHTLLLLLAGCVALMAAIVPVVLGKKHVSAPIIYLIIGAAAFLVIGYYDIHPLDQLEEIQHITEFVVLVALANAGLRIKSPFAWNTWKNAVRLLAIAMPITILAAVYLGWQFLALAPATAVLFGALISPTDPVLASELQTSEPGEPDDSKSKLGLTAEAGINDGLAFPFTWLAVFIAKEGTDFTQWWHRWLLHDLLLKTAIGVAVGLASGWLLYKMVFSISSKNETLSRISRGILSLSVILLPYALAEVIGGYGFLSVFFAACMFSNYEKHQEHMNSLHDFNEELESFAVAVIFITIGIFIAMHYRMLTDWPVMAVAALLVLVVRPAAGYLSLIGTKLNRLQRFALAFYGIRGIGSIFYLAFALTEADFEQPKKLIEITTATIFLSVVIHGVTARWIHKKIEKHDSEQ